MLFNSATVLIILRRTSIEVYGSEIDEPFVLSLTPEIVSHLEIKNEAAFKTAFQTFLEESGLKPQSALIGAAAEVIFEKKLAPEIDQDEQLQAFKELLPFESEHVLAMAADESSKMVAVNGQFLNLMTEVLNDLKWKSEGAVALTMLPGFSDSSPLSSEQVDEVLENAKSVLKKNNFLEKSEKNSKIALSDDEESVSEEESETQEPVPARSKQWGLLGVAGLLFLFAGAGILYALGVIKIPNSTAPEGGAEQSQVLSDEIQPTASPEMSASASSPVTSSLGITSPQKQELVISILNGSGVAGQASQLKAQLEKLGYTQIQTGNVSATASGSTVSFSQSVAEDIQTEVTQELQKSIPELKVQVVPELSSSDILVITAR